MIRRQFLGGSLLAATATTAGGPAGAEEKGGQRRAPGWYELRRFHLRTGAQPKIVNDFLAEVLVPALGRLGIGPVGVFETSVGPEMPAVHLLVPHDSPAAL